MDAAPCLFLLSVLSFCMLLKFDSLLVISTIATAIFCMFLSSCTRPICSLKIWLPKVVLKAEDLTKMNHLFFFCAA